ncbi:MAG: cation:proton antiporter [Pseudomonadota bacterium]
MELSLPTLGFMVIGVLLIVMTLTGSFISRLPLSAAMLYLGVGMMIGPLGMGLLDLDALRDAALLERASEIAVIISLFVAGMKLDIPWRDRRWRIPVQLATVSMVITVGAITALGYYVMHLPLGAAVLLGAVLAPTDPVLASDVQISNPGDRDRLRFGLTGEGGLNDGTAFPFVMLGLGLLSLHDLGEGAWRWWAIDVVWAVLGGLGIGYLLGTLVGKLVLFLRTQHREALGSDEFIALGLIALSYGVALACLSYGFLAVFAAGLALGRLEKSTPNTPQQESPPGNAQAEHGKSNAEGAPAEEVPANMMRAVRQFNAQLERFAEVGVVLAVGALLAVVEFRDEVLWFIPLLFLVIRPVAVTLGLWGTAVDKPQKRLMAWFGIRGIGSIYYLTYAINHGLDPATAERLVGITLAVVVASVVAHGISVTPLMNRYEERKERLTRRSKK